MGILDRANLADAPHHPILADPFSYDVVEFKYVLDTAPFGDLELMLQKDGNQVRLIFSGVHELEIDKGYPYSYDGLEILDVTYLGWETTRIRVQGFEDAPGIRFWAKAVARVGV